MNRSRWFPLFVVLIALVGLSTRAGLRAEEPLRSGPQPGQRPGPYAAVVSTGPQRGQSYCYVCETGPRPAVIVFAREPGETLGRLVQGVERELAKHKKADPRAWVTLLSADQPGLDAKVVEWTRKHAIGNIPVGIFEDVLGPPSYRLSPRAEVTVLLCLKQKVVANFAFAAGELSNEKTLAILKDLPRILQPPASPGDKPAAP